MFSVSSTNFGDKGIEYLITNQFPELSILRISNCDITREGLIKLKHLKAPKLMILDISCNDIDVKDIVDMGINYQNFSQFK